MVIVPPLLHPPRLTARRLDYRAFVPPGVPRGMTHEAGVPAGTACSWVIGYNGPVRARVVERVQNRSTAVVGVCAAG